MKNETLTWLSYADENHDVAELSLENGHLNSALQNAQQAVEKYLKALIIEMEFTFIRTHSIRDLVGLLSDKGIHINISDDDMDLMDTIYLPSKYPIYSALPNALPNPEICNVALKIVENIKGSVSSILNDNN
jgi:HEPN domain-containing protein